MAFTSLWIVFTLIAAGSQTLRNAMQRGLVESIGTLGATHVRFLFGLPFALLFLGLVSLFDAAPLPHYDLKASLLVVEGAVTQVIATGLMLAAMRTRSFVVTTAYTKTEPVQLAIFGLVVLGDHLTWLTGLAIVVATAGVMLMSFPRRTPDGPMTGPTWQPVALGLLSGAFFALSAIGYRAAILHVMTSSFVMAATATMTAGLTIQALSLALYMWLADGAALVAILRQWRPSLLAGFTGALASQFWFLAFALTSAAKVRTLGLVEVLFAQMISGRLLQERTSTRELVGIALIVIGIVVLVNG